nr:MAG TPA: hypothetical protein [Caudoviricetes sp.]
MLFPRRSVYYLSLVHKPKCKTVYQPYYYNSSTITAVLCLSSY